MTKPVIVTRATKGSALTWTEGDSNFTNLQNATITVSDGTTSTAIDLNGTITFAAGSGISVDEASGTVTITNTSAGGLSNVVEDTTPQLGGNLDVNGNQIVSVSNGNIVIAPNGTGMTKVSNLQYGEKVYSLGSTSGTITPDVANGNVQTITLTGNLTFSAFSNPVAGQSLTLIIDTNGTGRTLTSTMLFAGADKTISTTDTVDIISVFYDGTTYYASLAKGFA